MDNKIQNYFLAAGLGTATLLTGCEDKNKDWKNAPGTRGVINLDAVKKAFMKDADVLKFEKRVNEIFEGDNLIVLDSEAVDGGFKLAGKEDLDENKQSSPGDETLFILTVVDGTATLQGSGINSYYKQSWPYAPKQPKREERYYRSHYHTPFFYYWYFGRGWGRYYTPPQRYNDIRSHRTAYRKTGSYGSQVARNAGYEKQASQKYGSNFRKGTEKNSAMRESYIKKTVKSGKVPTKAANPAIGSKVRGKSGSPFSSRGASKGFGKGGFRGSSGFGV